MTSRALRRFVVLAYLAVSPLLIQEGRSCMCFSVPLCGQLPGVDEKRTIFVGKVVEVFPPSMDEFAALERAMFEGESEALERTKALMLRNWGPILSSDELQTIRLANSAADLFRVSDLGMYSRRVRFRVTEELEGSTGEAFQLFTDATDCGYKFHAGQEYLVVSHQNKETGRWSTGACSRSAPVESVDAQQDLMALRARREGHPLAPRIYGKIFDQQEGHHGGLPSALLRLVGGSSNRETVSDADGRFAFDNLAPARYRLEVGGLAERGSPKELDLSLGGCFEASVFIEREDTGTRFVVLGDGAPRVDSVIPPMIVPWLLP